jgi:hypothetical protein
MRNMLLPLNRSEIERYFVEPRFSSLIHSAIFEACTLIVNPTAKFSVFLVPFWHIACIARRDTSGALVGGIQDGGETV